ncbi:MAG: LysR family transcriptional regulator [Hyphomicrobiales bacterium]|nr:LysR family transcriptional regulator [Hyphomicrobiales bacterium]MCP4998473.1 LysR family transcriptional regulator [Hyphomicrobiales bacterium]
MRFLPQASLPLGSSVRPPVSLATSGRLELGALSPSAASARLSTLEKVTGTQLMARTTRSISLTKAGRVLLSHAQNALDEIDTAFDVLDASLDRPRGLLRISSNTFFGRKHILPYLNEFMQLNPDVRIEMSFSDRIVDIVVEGFDLAIRTAPLPDSSMMARKLGGNMRVLCASPQYIERHGAPVAPADLSNHACIGLNTMPVWYFDGPKGEISHTITPAITGDSGDYAYDSALCGLGLSIKSIAHVWEDLRDGRLVEVMKDYPVARTGNIWAVYPQSATTPPKVSALIDFLLSKYGRPPYWEKGFDDGRPSA